MGEALEQARLAAMRGEVPVGALVVDGDGRVLARAHNRPVFLDDPTAHAEILALRQACRAAGNYRLPGSVVYATLEPCVMCVGAMIHARVARVVYGAPDPKSGAAGSVMDLTSFPFFNHYVEVFGGLRARECSEVLKDFFRKRR